MTMLVYTYAALPPREDGSHPVHLYISQEEPTNTDFPKEERRAAEDASSLMSDIIGNEGDGDDTRLLQPGNIPVKAVPAFVFAIGVSWDRKTRLPHYFKVGYRRILGGWKWNPVAEVAMEQMEYTMSVIRKRENAVLREKGLRKPMVSSETRSAAYESFSLIADRILALQFHRMNLLDLAEKRQSCPCRHGCYCSTGANGEMPDMKCELYENGKCMEVGHE